MAVKSNRIYSDILYIISQLFPADPEKDTISAHRYRFACVLGHSQLQQIADTSVLTVQLVFLTACIKMHI